jgi:hypothetical protein
MCDFAVGKRNLKRCVFYALVRVLKIQLNLIWQFGVFKVAKTHALIAKSQCDYVFQNWMCKWIFKLCIIQCIASFFMEIVGKFY